MNETVLDDHAPSSPRVSAIISGRSLLLRLAFAIVTILTLSIGGAWLMYAGIDQVAEATEGAAAPGQVESATSQPGTR